MLAESEGVKGRRLMNLILLGAPGAGKGTQAQKLSSSFSIPQVSTGDMLRAAISSQTALGMKAKGFMDEGKLVPDEVVVGIVSERLRENDCDGGFILDGFPRTTGQADALSQLGIQIEHVIHLTVSAEAVTERLGGRRSCPGCGAMFHVAFAKPTEEGVCDSCGGDLIQRKDDNPKTILERLSVYEEKTAPLVSYYGNKGILKTVSGEGDTDEITRGITQILAG